MPSLRFKQCLKQCLSLLVLMVSTGAPTAQACSGLATWEPGARIAESDLIAVVKPSTWLEDFSGYSARRETAKFSTVKELKVQQSLTGKILGDKRVLLYKRSSSNCDPIVLDGEEQIMFLKRLKAEDIPDWPADAPPLSTVTVYDFVPGGWPAFSRVRFVPGILKNSHLVAKTGITPDRESIVAYIQNLIDLYRNGAAKGTNLADLDVYKKDVLGKHRLVDLDRRKEALTNERHIKYIRPHP